MQRSNPSNQSQEIDQFELMNSILSCSISPELATELFIQASDTKPVTLDDKAISEHFWLK